MVTLHDLYHCSIKNLKFARNDHFTLMTISCHKTTSVFRRYTVVIDDDLRGKRWKNHGNFSVHMSVHQPQKMNEVG